MFYYVSWVLWVKYLGYGMQVPAINYHLFAERFHYII